jgi:hypothetical protein
MKWKLKGPKMIQSLQKGRLKNLYITKGVVCDIVCQHIDEPLGFGPKAPMKQMVKKTPNIHFGPYVISKAYQIS